MTEMQAAIGLRQLAKLPAWSAARRRNSLIMQEALRDIPGIRVPHTPAGHAHYRCVAFTEGHDAGAMRNRLLKALHTGRIPAMHGSCSEIYMEEAFRRRGFTPEQVGRGTVDRDGRLPNARRLGETSLTFLCHHTIDEARMHEYASRARTCIADSMRSSGTRLSAIPTPTCGS
jgi:dTDP-4-amino-4,6-dideoxygalactose transaminase